MLTNEDMMAIMDDYGTYLTQLSFMYVKNWSTAEDIVQETFITYFKKHTKFDGKSSLKTYLSKIVIHKSIDHLRSLKTKTKLLMLMMKGLPEEIVGSDQILLAKIANSEIYKHVLSLKVKYREVIVLYYYENMTTVEIAQLLNLPEGTIRTRLLRGRRLLKDLLCDVNMEVFQVE